MMTFQDTKANSTGVPGDNSEISNRSILGRKRKMNDKEMERRENGRNNVKRQRKRLAESESSDAKNHDSLNQVQAPVVQETDMMRYGRLLGYNVVPDYNNYMVVRSVYGYGNISQSSSVSRSTESADCRSSEKSVRLSGKTRRYRRHYIRSVPTYLVVQSAAGYGNISQSGGATRISSYTQKTSATLNTTVVN